MNLPPPTLKFSIIVSSVALGIGMTAPTITITPGAGELTPLVELLSPQELEPRSYSIIGVIEKLYDGGDWFLAGALSIFSIFFSFKSDFLIVEKLVSMPPSQRLLTKNI